MDTLPNLLDILLHVDKYLGLVLDQYGTWVYAILALVVFAETGLVVTPFLPGDSLLFIAGAFCAGGSMDVGLLLLLLSAAAILGNTVNYWIGRKIGHKIWDMDLRFIDHAALRKTHDFYERHGGKTIVMARFIPLVRTFAPFVAGVSGMSGSRFQAFNVIGAVAWVASMVLGGYFLGNLPFVRQYLNVIVLVGIGAVIVPLVLGGLVRMLRGKRAR